MPRTHSGGTLEAVGHLSSLANLKEHRNYWLFERNLVIVLGPASSQVVGNMQFMGPDAAEREVFQSYNTSVPSCSSPFPGPTPTIHSS